MKPQLSREMGENRRLRETEDELRCGRCEGEQRSGGQVGRREGGEESGGRGAKEGRGQRSG